MSKKPTIIFVVLLCIATIIVVYQTGLSQTIVSNASSTKPPVSLGPPLVGLSQLSNAIDALRVADTSRKHLYQIAAYGYTLLYDSSLWQQSLQTPPLGVAQRNLFTLSEEFGRGKVTIDVMPIEINQDTNKPDQSEDTLRDIIRRQLESNYRSDGSFVSSSDTTLGGINATKIIRKERHFGYDIPFDEYSIVGKQYSYRIEAKYDTVTSAKQVIDQLLDTFTLENRARKVLGVSKDANKEVLSTYEATQLVELSKPSVAAIVHVHCYNVLPKDIRQLHFLQTGYRFCFVSKGSGVIISSDGLIATNGHVVKSYPEEMIVQNLFTEGLSGFTTDLVRELLYKQTSSTVSIEETQKSLQLVKENPTAASAVITSFYNLVDAKVLTLSTASESYIVSLGLVPISYDKKKLTAGDVSGTVVMDQDMYKAALLAFDAPNRYAVDVILRKKIPSGSDIAVLRLENVGTKILPALPFAQTDNLQVGSPLVVIGFPALVEGTDANTASLIDYQTSSAQQTVTRGIVSSIKRDEGGRRLIQTDASIDLGNSGGPALDEHGHVVGLATYAFESQSGNYNFLRGSEDVMSLMRDHFIERAPQNPVYTLWTMGLGYFWRQQYINAIKAFTQVKKLYPDHPTVSEYITQSEKAISLGQDKTYAIDGKKLFQYGALAVVGLGIVAWLSTFLLWKKTSKIHKQLGQS
ncbi:trypsin-like peptidase domain-containing protein [Candidatus Gottesmanbacteria bacterium]|nr:trypsin-like peptidase domain-containing protein [Candidatus Gottesmanbacteria bacterium]